MRWQNTAYIDEAMGGAEVARAGSKVRAHWLDKVFALVTGRPRLFADGWGDPGVLDEFLRYINNPGEPEVLEPSLRRITDRPGCDTLAGTFVSRAPSLPPESRRAHFQLVLPAGRANVPVCVLLASSGDEGYGLRRYTHLPLLQRGLGLLLLENPFYGVRRPQHQQGTGLRTVSGHLAMCHATVREAVGLLAWLRRRGHKSVGVSGYSLGGSMAALTAVCAPFPIAVVLGATGLHGGRVMTQDLLSRQVHWDRLGDPITARREIVSQCERASLDRLPPPREPSSAILVACTHDGYVDGPGVRALHRHWRRSTLRWIKAGHVSGLAVHAAAFRQATVDAFARRAARTEEA